MFSVCRICLTGSGNTRLYSIKNKLLIEIYEKLSSAKFYAKDARPSAVCCFCYQKLLKCHTFSEMANRSEIVLSHLSNQGFEATQEYITKANLGMKPLLTVATMQYIIIDGKTPIANSTIKHEPIPFMEIKKETTSEPDQWVEVETILEDCIQNPFTPEDSIDQGHYEVLSHSIHHEETKPDDLKITFNCNNCNEIFFNEIQLVSHVKNSHLQGSQNSCAKLNKKQSGNSSTNTTIKNPNQKKTFQCHVCDKELNRKITLNAHLRLHTGEKPFACNICDKKFNAKPYLIVHMRNHTGEKPFACNICDKKFNSKHYLIVHMRNHTGEKPFTCNICDKQFKQHPHLISHMRMHTGEKPFTCNICGKVFRHKKSLDFHMKSHTGVRPFACNECGQQFKMKSLNSETKIYFLL